MKDKEAEWEAADPAGYAAAAAAKRATRAADSWRCRARERKRKWEAESKKKFPRMAAFDKTLQAKRVTAMKI